jgi:hypothetical protein
MKNTRLAALTAILAAGAAYPALAVDVTIVDGQTETVTQTLAGDGDTLTIETGGTLSTGSDVAIQLRNANQVVSNHGIISTTTEHGIDVGAGADYATIINSGTLTFGGTDRYGVNSAANHTNFRNTGKVIVLDDCTYGVVATRDYFTFTNEGTVSVTSGTSGHAFYASGNSATVINHGLMTSEGTDSHVVNIWGGLDATITNHGTVRALETGSIGIYAYGGSQNSTVITNTGTVEALGATGAQAIYANSPGATVINSGKVISRHSESIYMGRPNQTLRLLNGSQLEGDIKFENPESGTIELGQGVNAVLTIKGTGGEGSGIPATIRTGGQRYVVSGDTLTVFDEHLSTAGSQGASATATAVSTALGSHVGDRRLASGSAPLPLGYAPTRAAPDFPDFAPSEDFGAWISGYGSLSNPTGGRSGTETMQAGGLAGFDTKLADDMLAGVFVGFGRGVVKTTGRLDVDTTTFTGGAYASLRVGDMFIDLNAAVGGTANRSTRKVINNRAPGGIETAHGEYGGLFFSPTVTFGVDHEINGARLTPSVALMYAGVYQAGYTETGATTNLSLGSQFGHVLNARAEVELGTLDLGGSTNGWNASVKVGADGTVVQGGDVAVTVLGSSNTQSGVASVEARGFAGADLKFTSNGFTFNAGTEVGYNTVGNVTASLRGGVGARF